MFCVACSVQYNITRWATWCIIVLVATVFDELLKLYYRVKTYIENGWDSKIIDPDPQKLYTK